MTPLGLVSFVAKQNLIRSLRESDFLCKIHEEWAIKAAHSGIFIKTSELDVFDSQIIKRRASPNFRQLHYHSCTCTIVLPY